MGAVPEAAAADIDRPMSAPSTSLIPAAPVRPTVHFSLGSAMSTPDSVPKVRVNGTAGKVKGMQLGAQKLPVSSHIHDHWAEEAAAEAEAEETNNTNPWGNDDLMDVNADQDDWSEFCYGFS